MEGPGIALHPGGAATGMTYIEERVRGPWARRARVAQPGDVKMLDSTIDALRRGALRENLGLRPAKIVAVIHASKSVNAMISKMLASRTKRNAVYRSASCKERMEAIMKDHGIR